MFVLHCQSDLCMSIICNACSTLLNILRTVLCFSADGHGGIIQIERRLCCCVVFREIVRKKSNELLLTPSTSCFNQFLGVWELSVLKNLKYFVNIFYQHTFYWVPIYSLKSSHIKRKEQIIFAKTDEKLFNECATDPLSSLVSQLESLPISATALLQPQGGLSSLGSSPGTWAEVRKSLH